MQKRSGAFPADLPPVRLAEAYPPLRVAGKNAAYAQMMLDNLGGGNSEMTAAAAYFYAGLMLPPQNPTLIFACRELERCEVEHARLFGALARLLGADPRLWSLPCGMPVYWTPGYLAYPRTAREMLEALLEGELAAIAKYEMQVKRIRDADIIALLQRIIQEETQHAALLRALQQRLDGEAGGHR